MFIELKDCLNARVIKNGMKVMITEFGVGLNWGGTVLKFV
ncbi:hypothetical protein [Mediterranea sp. An20]